MDIEKLIERLKAKDFERDYDCTPFECGVFGLLDDTATALSTLWDENERLRTKLQKSEHDNVNLTGELAKVAAELEQVKRALAMMWFSYVNSDKEMPHSYETEALEEAEHILGPWAECMPKYLRRGPKED